MAKNGPSEGTPLGSQDHSGSDGSVPADLYVGGDLTVEAWQPKVDRVLNNLTRVYGADPQGSRLREYLNYELSLLRDQAAYLMVERKDEMMKILEDS